MIYQIYQNLANSVSLPVHQLLFDKSSVFISILSFLQNYIL